MHLVVTWQINTKKPESLVEGLAELKACFEEHSWIKPMKNTWFYIIKVDDKADAARVRRALVAVCKDHPGTFHLVVSPPLEGTGYTGYLPSSMWSKIRERTD